MDTTKIRKYIEGNGGTLNSLEGKKVKWSCENNHPNTSNPFCMLSRGSWCRQCSMDLTRRKVEETVRGRFELIEFSSVKCSLKCDSGHSFLMSPGHILGGNGCKECFFEKRRQSSPNKLDKALVETRLSKMGFKFLDQEYKSIITNHTLQCEKGHIFNDKRLAHILDGVTGCPLCNNYYKTERKIRGLIEEISGVKFPKVRPKWLINPETGYRLELDGFNSDLNLAFEYDGQFHYEVRKGLNNDLERTKILDSLKNRLCEELNIRLIRIPFFMKDEEVRELIEKEVADARRLHK
jgi:hypothetical protein